jgi:hypothetical protein
VSPCVLLARRWRGSLAFPGATGSGRRTKCETDRSYGEGLRPGPLAVSRRRGARWATGRGADDAPAARLGRTECHLEGVSDGPASRVCSCLTVLSVSGAENATKECLSFRACARVSKRTRSGREYTTYSRRCRWNSHAFVRPIVRRAGYVVLPRLEKSGGSLVGLHSGGLSSVCGGWPFARPNGS